LKPLIGITVDCKHDPEDNRTRGQLELHWNYAQAVADAGGIPLMIPPMADMEAVAGVIHGWLIPGGDDIDASRFGEENHPKVSLQDPARFEGEKRLWEQIPTDLPVLGICYGCQFLNVARGGSLIQHLPDVVGHESHSGGTMQEYQIEQGSSLEAIVGAGALSGMSYHHQAVNTVGENLRVVGKNEDGTIEAIEATDRPWIIGVQWHPERTLESTPSQHIFEKFIRAATAFAEGRRPATR
jgi:gamma-glutamyl-gamma-aminobutyrate hydrolase PuuD